MISSYKAKLCLVLGILLCVFYFATAQNLKQITNNDGLSNSSINVIYQDSYDLMWFGTWDGLNKYNGREIEVFKPTLSPDRPQINSNIIRDIAETEKGEIWFATDNGISKYNHNSKEFKNYFTDNKDIKIFRENSFFITKNNKNQLFAAIYNVGLFYYSDVLDDFLPIAGIDHKLMKKIFVDRQSRIWFMTESNELYKVELAKDREDEFIFHASEKVDLIKDISTLFYDSGSNRIWVQDINYDIFYWEAGRTEIQSIPLQSKERINALLIDQGLCYIGTGSRLIKYNSATNISETEINNVPILSIYKGSQDILWIGTDGHGILTFTPDHKKFVPYTLRSGNMTSKQNPVRCFWENDNGDLYIGTKGSGIFMVSPNNTIKKHFDVQDGLISKSVYTIVDDSINNVCWLGTDQMGLLYLNPKTNKIFGLKNTPPELNSISIYAVYPQNDSILWVGSYGSGLFKFVINTDELPYTLLSHKKFIYEEGKSTISNNNIFSIVPHGDNHLFIGTRGGGINYFNIGNEKFEDIQTITTGLSEIGNDILSIHKSKNNTLWIGTSMGLAQVDCNDENQEVILFTEKNGIPNNTIHGILEDKQGNIWVSTNKGIAKLNLSDKKIISFYEDEGLQNNEFADGAYYKSEANGFFYFGGIDGYNKFKPENISEDYYTPKLNFDGLYINNQIVDINNHLKNGKLILNYTDNQFGFSFTPIDYISGLKCEISYRMVNQSQDWVQMGSSRMIVFSKLPFGNYTLLVRYCNANKVWADEIYELPVKILPPIWLTWQAVVLYILLISAAIYFVQRSFKNKVRIKHRLEINKLEKQKTEEIHQAKLRFFTNIAHEFCNSLTLIYSPAEQLQKLKGNDVIVKKHINTIKTNAERMNHLIQELMDFRKAETGFLELKIEQLDVLELTKYTSDYFMYVAEQKNIKFDIVYKQEDITWTSDRNSLEKILFNLISNAFKYTPENGTISLHVNIENNFLVVTIQNSGKGINESDQQHIFNRFKILENFESEVMKGETRTGIGLALSQSLITLLKGKIEVDSKVNEYTIFTITLPRLDENVTTQKKQKTKGIRADRALDYVNEAMDEPHDTVQPVASTETPLNGKPSILIVDDDEGIKDVLYDILSPKYNLTYAKDGQEGYEIVRGNHFDLIICDIMMPNIDGIELIGKIKSDSANTTIPIVILSSLTSVDSQLEGLKIGADAYINKPFHSSFLELKIENLLSQRNELRRYYNSPLSSMEKYKGNQIQKEDKEFIIKLSKIVSDNLDNENLSTEMLSNEMGISKMQLYRKVKEIKNETPTEFIRFMRLEKTEKLLISTNKNIQEIIYECGFNNKAYFYQEFLKKNNMTPKEYRKKAQGN